MLWRSIRTRYLGAPGVNKQTKPVRKLMTAVWTQVPTSPAGPGPRSSHSLNFCNNQIFIYGGERKARETINNDLVVFDLSEKQWHSVPASLPTRLGHASIVVGSKIFFHGGRTTDKKELEDLWSFDVNTGVWEEIQQGAQKPPGRSYHALTASNNKLYVFGGCGPNCRWDDLWEFDLNTNNWEKLPGGPSQRGGPVFVTSQNDSSKLFLIFGFNGKEMDDVWEYSIPSKAWKQITASGQIPSARSVHAGCAFNDYVFIFGGEGAPSGVGHEGAGAHFNDSFLLNTKTYEWTKLNSENPPKPRGWMVATWIPEGAAVFGGLDDANQRIDELHLCKIES